MSFEVIIEELVAAAGSLEDAANAYGCYSLPVSDATGENYGHVELAGWVVGVGKAVDDAVKALQDAQLRMGTNLRTCARDYDEADRSAEQGLQCPVGPVFGPPFTSPTGLTAAPAWPSTTAGASR